ncbi:hypothetical protein HMPREF3232_00618 [Fannyhessea vaginae]|nr:hypothetical protein HMPREF3232_00618 [Fannyhessea vaginae]
MFDTLIPDYNSPGAEARAHQRNQNFCTYKIILSYLPCLKKKLTAYLQN